MKRIKISEPQLDQKEKRILKEVLDTKMIASGSYVKKFEEVFAGYIGSKFGVATTSGTSALHTALLAADVGKDDIVVTTPFSFIATANSVLFVGAKPEFIDIDEHSFNIDPVLLEKRLQSRKKKPKAVIIVHLYGNPVDMPRILKICKRHKVTVIEDCAQSHGASISGKLTGTFGAMGCFSFYATKNMTTGEGGMVTTNSTGFYNKCKKIINHGRVSRFKHDILGFNFRMTNLQAGIGLVQINKLEKMTTARIKNAEYLNKKLSGFSWLEIPAVDPGSRHVYHQYTIKVSAGKRDKMVRYLIDNGIDASMIYPLIIPEQPLYKKLGYKTENVKVALKVSRQVVSLPVHPGLTRKDLDKLVKVIGDFNG